MFKTINQKMESTKKLKDWITIAGFDEKDTNPETQNKVLDVYLGNYYYPVNEDIKKKADELKNEIRFKFGSFTDDSKRRQFIDQFNQKYGCKISYRDIWIELDENGDQRIVDPRGGACGKKRVSINGVEYNNTICHPQPLDKIKKCFTNTGGKKSKKSKKPSKKRKSKKSKTIKHKRN
jgi:hypothetical protein